MDGQDIIKHSQLKPGRHTWFARTPFAVAAVGGGALLYGLKIFGIEQIWVTVVAIALIAAYALIVALTPVLRLREDQLADNCYYLGFLYTLFSLALALETFSKTGEETEIVANFGIALGSTIFGILLRVIINQARKDVIETEADARMELAQAVVRLRVEIDDAVLALSSFCKQTEQTASDSIRATAERASSVLEGGLNKVGESSKTVLERIDSAFAEFTEHASQLNAASSGTVRGLKALLTRIEKIEAPIDLISKRLDPAFQAMEAGVRTLRQRLEQEERAMATAAERTAAATERLNSAMAGMANAGNGIASTSEAALRASQAAEQAAERLTALVATSEKATKEQERLSTDATAGTARMSTALLEEQHRLTVGAKGGLDALLEAFKAHNEAMAVELARSRRMTAEVGQALADLADAVSARVRGTPSNAAPLREGAVGA